MTTRSLSSPKSLDRSHQADGFRLVTKPHHLGWKPIHGAIGTAVGQQHLRQILGILGSVVLGGEAYLQFKPDLIDADGTLTNDGTRAFLQAHVDRFAELVAALARR